MFKPKGLLKKTCPLGTRPEGRWAITPILLPLYPSCLSFVARILLNTLVS